MALHSIPGLLLLLLLGAASVSAQQSCDSNTLEVSYPKPTAADGWSYRLVAQDLSRPRGIVFDSEGGLLVIDSGAGLTHFSLEDNGGTCVSVSKKTVLVDNEDLNHGIALSSDGNTLYASTSDEVYSWPYNASSPSPLDEDSRRTLVTNMSSSGHTTRTLLLSRSRPGLLFVSRGSNSNSDTGTAELDSGRSQIRSFNLTDLPDDPYDFLDGDVWAWGVRNSVGLAEDPVHGGLWSVENSVDQLSRDGQDVHSDNPGEELNFHGFVNGSAGPLEEVGEANNYGYPTCFAVWSTDDVPDSGDLKTGDQFAGDSEETSDETCRNDYVAPMLTFQAHMAPLDIKFTEDGSEAFISFHGSWDRDDPVGYKISSISFANGMPSASSDSRDAAKDILSTPDLSNCPDDCFRPAGLAWDSKGRLWFSSDSTGEIMVMERAEGGGGGNSTSGGDSSDDDEGAGVALLQPGVTVGVGAVIVGLLLA